MTALASELVDKRISQALRTVHEIDPEIPGELVLSVVPRSELADLKQDEVDSALRRLARKPGVYVHSLREEEVLVLHQAGADIATAPGPATVPTLPAAQAKNSSTAAAVDTAWRLHAHAAAEITKADAKASFAATIELFGLVAVFDGKAGGPDLFLWIGSAGLAVAVVLSVLVVMPALRSRRSQPGSWHYFGALRHMPVDELTARLKAGGDLDVVAEQVTALSAVAHTKLARLRLSLLLALPSSVLIVLAALV